MRYKTVHRGLVHHLTVHRGLVHQLTAQGIDLSVDDVTVSVYEARGKSVFIGRDNLACLYRDFGGPDV